MERPAAAAASALMQRLALPPLLLEAGAGGTAAAAAGASPGAGPDPVAAAVQLLRHLHSTTTATPNATSNGGQGGQGGEGDEEGVRALREFATQVLLGALGDAHAVAQRPPLLHAFLNLPYPAVLAWASSDELVVGGPRFFLFVVLGAPWAPWAAPLGYLHPATCSI